MAEFKGKNPSSEGPIDLAAASDALMDDRKTDNSDGSTSTGRTIGFASQYRIKSLGSGGEYTKKFVEMLNLVLTGDEYKVHVIDREQETNMQYSYVAISKYANGVAVYFTFILEATGKRPLTVYETDQGYRALYAANSTGVNPFTRDLYTASDAIDRPVINGFDKMVTDTYSGKLSNPPLRLDSMVIPYSIALKDLTEDTVKAPVTIAYNICEVELAQAIKEATDLNIDFEMKNLRNGEYPALRIDIGHTTHNNEVDTPLRTDFSIDSTVISKSPQRTINEAGGERIMCRVSGYVDTMIGEVTLPSNGFQQLKAKRMHPGVIINNVDIAYPTLGFALFAIANAALMVDDKQRLYMTALRPSGSRDDVNNFGVLNQLVNMEGNQTGTGKVLKESDLSKMSQIEIDRTLTDFYCMAPNFGIDVEVGGPQFGYLSAISTAASKLYSADERESRMGKAAARDIVLKAHYMTNGKFPKDFDITQIFVPGSVLQPVVQWEKDNVKRDGRHFDATYNKNTRNMIEAAVNSSLPTEYSGLDPYAAKIGYLKNVAENGVVTGKYVRCMFTMAFIKQLADALKASLYKPTFDAPTASNVGDEMASASRFASTASMGSGTAGFATQTVHGGQFVSTGFGTPRMF